MRISYRWQWSTSHHRLDLTHVDGTTGRPFPFGEVAESRPMEVKGFFIATVPVTQAFWAHVMGTSVQPAGHGNGRLPMENVSWDQITQAGGFLDRLNRSAARAHLLDQIKAAAGEFRLPTEAEWEYAARGGPHWPDRFRFSGGNDIDKVAWYDRKQGDCTKPVALKAPNQLGLYDMSGNVWEWCQDVFVRDSSSIPGDGTAMAGDAPERVLRGGCFHNWAMHCTVSKRYEIARDYRDGCIGFRLVFGDSHPSKSPMSLNDAVNEGYPFSYCMEPPAFGRKLEFNNPSH